MPPLFRDRQDAGNQLALRVLDEIAKLSVKTAQTGSHPESDPRSDPSNTTPCIVYALPRGGVPIAEPIARSLGCPLDVLVAKKITLPDDPELAIGAVTAEGHVLWAEPKPTDKKEALLWQASLQTAQEKAQTQQAQFANIRPQVSPQTAIAILVDDGIATGMTIAVAAQALRKQHPAQIWICTPVAPFQLVRWINQWSDRTLILATPDPFFSVSRFYEKFPQVEMEEVIYCLRHQNSDAV